MRYWAETRIVTLKQDGSAISLMSHLSLSLMTTELQMCDSSEQQYTEKTLSMLKILIESHR